MNASDFEFLCSLVRERSAIVIEGDKAYLLEARVESLRRVEGFEDIAAIVSRLREGDSLLEEKVVEAMTTNETSFFRDSHPFELLKAQVLPELIKKRSKEKKLRIWCAACSSGQEAYSLAMLLDREFPELSNWSCELLGTDISKPMLEHARAGVYSQLEANRGLPADYRERYFTQDGGSWILSPQIRDRVHYQQLNLIGPWPEMEPMDLILIRNVLIYFDVATKKVILGKMRELLQPDGYLFLGGSETTLNIDDAYERVIFDSGACYKLRG